MPGKASFAPCVLLIACLTGLATSIDLDALLVDDDAARFVSDAAELGEGWETEQSADGFTVLTKSAQLNRLNIVESILATQDEAQYAARYIVGYIGLETGNDEERAALRAELLVNQQDGNGQAPLHVAAAAGHGAMCTALMRFGRGADPVLLNADGQTAFQIASAVNAVSSIRGENAVLAALSVGPFAPPDATPENGDEGHFRYGTLSWVKKGARTIAFTLHACWRRSYGVETLSHFQGTAGDGRVQVGDVVELTGGDGLQVTQFYNGQDDDTGTVLKGTVYASSAGRLTEDAGASGQVGEFGEDFFCTVSEHEVVYKGSAKTFKAHYGGCCTIKTKNTPTKSEFSIFADVDVRVPASLQIQALPMMFTTAGRGANIGHIGVNTPFGVMTRAGSWRLATTDEMGGVVNPLQSDGHAIELDDIGALTFTQGNTGDYLVGIVVASGTISTSVTILVRVFTPDDGSTLEITLAPELTPMIHDIHSPEYPSSEIFPSTDARPLIAYVGYEVSYPMRAHWSPDNSVSETNALGRCTAANCGIGFTTSRSSDLTVSGVPEGSYPRRATVNDEISTTDNSEPGAETADMVITQNWEWVPDNMQEGRFITCYAASTITSYSKGIQSITACFETSVSADPHPTWTESEVVPLDTPADGTEFTYHMGLSKSFSVYCTDVNFYDTLTIEEEFTPEAMIRDFTLPDDKAFQVKATYTWNPGTTFGGYNKQFCTTCGDKPPGNEFLHKDTVTRCYNLVVVKCKYVTSQGDTFASIAATFGMDELSVWAMNVEYTKFDLVAGDQTWIGRMYRVEQGDTLYDLASAFGTSVENIKMLNYDMNAPGEDLVLKDSTLWPNGEEGALSTHLCIYPNSCVH